MTIAPDAKKPLTNHATLMFRWHTQIAADPTSKRQATAMQVVDCIHRKSTPTQRGVEFQQRWLTDELDVTRKGLQKAAQPAVRWRVIAMAGDLGNIITRKTWAERNADAAASKGTHGASRQHHQQPAFHRHFPPHFANRLPTAGSRCLRVPSIGGEVPVPQRLRCVRDDDRQN
jgi:hypothetical protein